MSSAVPGCPAVRDEQFFVVVVPAVSKRWCPTDSLAIDLLASQSHVEQGTVVVLSNHYRHLIAKNTVPRYTTQASFVVPAAGQLPYAIWLY